MIVERHLNRMLSFDDEKGIYTDKYNVGLFDLIVEPTVAEQQLKAVKMAAARELFDKGYSPFGIDIISGGISIPIREAIKLAIVNSGLPLLALEEVDRADELLSLFHS
jgi:hypothetical protein